MQVVLCPLNLMATNEVALTLLSLGLELPVKVDLFFYFEEEVVGVLA